MVIYPLLRLCLDAFDEIIESSAMQGGLPEWCGAVRL